MSSILDVRLGKIGTLTNEELDKLIVDTQEIVQPKPLHEITLAEKQEMVASYIRAKREALGIKGGRVSLADVVTEKTELQPEQIKAVQEIASKEPPKNVFKVKVEPEAPVPAAETLLAKGFHSKEEYMLIINECEKKKKEAVLAQRSLQEDIANFEKEKAKIYAEKEYVDIRKKELYALNDKYQKYIEEYSRLRAGK